MAPSAGVLTGLGSRAAARPASATTATVTISASWKAGSTSAAPSAPADEPSSPTPTTTPVTDSHSRRLSLTCISQAANTAVTARFAAIMACTAKIGSRCNATSWATNPTRSMPRLTMKRHWPSSRTTRPGSTRSAAASPARMRAGRRLADWIAIACSTAAIP